ncbi:uncharacterized protein LOC109849122 isoform X2 [Asparagus officinalis]|nr:uncharacterized protein LOC109849122 isoform X2 [Asparagus officinalis]
MPRSNAPPEVFLGNLEKYLYVHKGFHRTNVLTETRALYLHSVLTCRSGSSVMLSLIYSETLKMLRVLGFLDFDVEIYFPHDPAGLPYGYHKLKSKLEDQAHILTSKALLVEILRNLKDAFWPFQYENYNSLFLRAAHASNHIYGPSIVGERYSESCSSTSGLEIASTKAAQHRLGRGVWTNVRFGDMRRALAASERLVILTNDYQELRDYAILLYHCGYYEECLHNLRLYETFKEEGGHAQQRSRLSQTHELEEDAVRKLMARVNLILGEEGWSESISRKSYWGQYQEPW